MTSLLSTKSLLTLFTLGYFSNIKGEAHFKTFFADSDAEYVVMTDFFSPTVKAQKQQSY